MQNTFPTKDNPLALYKYTGIELNMSQDTKLYNRETYGTLDYLGDLGGLNDALFVIFSTLMVPISRFALNSTLLASLFRWQPRHFEKSSGRVNVACSSIQSKRETYLRKYFNSDPNHLSYLERIVTHEFQVIQTIKRLRYYIFTFCCDRHYRQLVNKSSTAITKELDLR